MAYVTVPKDLTKVKSKVVFGLTKRQLICFGGALLVGVPLFFLIRGRVPTSAAALIMVFAMLPGFLLALYEKHGQPLEVVVRQIVECCFIQPKERPYQTNNAYTALVRQSQMEKEVNAIVQKAKERNERKSAGQAHPRRKERDSGRHPKVYPLVKRLHGQVVKLSPTSKNYVNPLDINLNYSEDENPLALKSDFVLSFCELVMGGKNGLEAIEKTVIDRAVQVIYRPYLANPKPENMPILADLHKALLDQHIPEADRVAQALDLYVSGSLNVFNHRTNIDIQNRIVAFDIKELGKQLKKIGMLIVQDQIWGRVTQNRSKGKATWYFCDEFHLLLREEQTAAFSCEIWKRFRKWGGIPTGATQNVKVRPDRALCKAV